MIYFDGNSEDEMAKRKYIGRSEDQSECVQLRREQQELEERREQIGKEWSLLHAKLDESGSQTALMSSDTQGWRELREQRAKIGKRLSELEAESAKAKERLFEIKNEMPLVRHRAARALVAAKAAPTINAATRRFLASRLQRLAPEIVSVVEMAPIRDELDVRRIGFFQMQIARTMNLCEKEFEQLREDTQAALGAGVLKRSDVPKELLSLWGI